MLTEEEPSPERISPKSTDLLRTLHDGLVSRKGYEITSIDADALKLAKSLVSAGLARRALVQLSYAIGVAEPLSIYVDTYGTGKKTDEELVAIIRKNWDLRPGVIGMFGNPHGLPDCHTETLSSVKELDLQKPIYLKTASYGHFGRSQIHLRPTVY